MIGRRGRRRRAAGKARRWLGDQQGFTLTELMIAVGVMGLVVAPCVSVYLATTHSWQGTAALADVQRDAAFATEVMVRAIRPASEVRVGARPDSMEVVFHRAAGDSVGARYYVNQDRQLVDINGIVLVEGVDSVVFAISGGIVSIDITLTDDSGTPLRWTDDQSVLMSSSVVCRNP